MECASCSLAILIVRERPGGLIAEDEAWCHWKPKPRRVDRDHWCGQYAPGGPRDSEEEPLDELLDELTEPTQPLHIFNWNRRNGGGA
jgi:hypothetical protein